MNRNEIIEKLKSLVAGGTISENQQWERYSTSDLKKILDDMLTVTVEVKPAQTFNMTIVLLGVFAILGIVLVTQS